MESIQAIIIVRQFPPKALFNNEVNFESRYGTYIYLFWVVAYSKIFITFLRTNSDLLI